MPLYIPWLTENLKKKCVSYLLQHYLGQFFHEKLRLDQLSIEIFQGKGAISNLALNVDGLNDELGFIPFKFLEGCTIKHISVEVPWTALSNDACLVELDGAKFVCRMKTSADGAKGNCSESTLLTRSLMTSSMQMAEDIVEDEWRSQDSSMFSSAMRQTHTSTESSHSSKSGAGNKDAGQIFEGLEMFAQLIDSVLRRTKLTARNTLFQIQPHPDRDAHLAQRYASTSTNRPDESSCGEFESGHYERASTQWCGLDTGTRGNTETDDAQSAGTVEFMIKFFRCEEIIEENGEGGISSELKKDGKSKQAPPSAHSSESGDETASQSGETADGSSKKEAKSKGPEIITKVLTLEDVEMRIGGKPVSSLTGRHVITIKFNGQMSDISIFSGSPLLAVIGHEQLKTFFNVFDSSEELGGQSMAGADCPSPPMFGGILHDTTRRVNQKLMSPEDFAKIENQMIENVLPSSSRGGGADDGCGFSGLGAGRRWVDTNLNTATFGVPSSSSDKFEADKSDGATAESALDHIEAFSCELKLPGIWLCILRDGQRLPPLIQIPTREPCSTFEQINGFMSRHIHVPHIRVLALHAVVSLNSDGIRTSLADLDISEHRQHNLVCPKLQILRNNMNDLPINLSKINNPPTNQPIHKPGISSSLADLASSITSESTSSSSIESVHPSRYTAVITNQYRDIQLGLMTQTRLTIDPTLIDRLVYEYKLVKAPGSNMSGNTPGSVGKSTASDPFGSLNSVSRGILGGVVHGGPSLLEQRRKNKLDINLVVKGDQFKVELLCPIPDLRPESHDMPNLLRLQSFLFDVHDISLTWHSDKLNVSMEALDVYIRSHAQQADFDAVRFLEARSSERERISLELEPNPTNLDDYPNEYERTLNECSMYDSIYVSKAIDSQVITEPFQTKRHVVQNGRKRRRGSNNSNKCEEEKILTPGDRNHLTDYIKQMMSSTKLSIDLVLPFCEVKFEDKQQLDIIYNRFANDFVFWKPKALSKKAAAAGSKHSSSSNPAGHGASSGRKRSSVVSSCGGTGGATASGQPARPLSSNVGALINTSVGGANHHHYHHQSYGANDHLAAGGHSGHGDGGGGDCESDTTYHSLSGDSSTSGHSDNEVTCRIRLDDLQLRFQHQHCAAAMQQEICAENVLIGVVLDVNKRSNTLLSLVADNLDLRTDDMMVVEGNEFGADRESIFSLTVDIRRPSANVKELKIAVQLINGLFHDLRSDTYTRFWQSINVTDEPILGYTPPKIVTEFHVDILSSSVLIARPRMRPALLAIDELYMTSVLVEKTNQILIRFLADDIALYLKRNCADADTIKNYVCLIDSGYVDLDVKVAPEGQIELDVINNVIQVRVCQDSLTGLCKLFDMLLRSNISAATAANLADATVEQANLINHQHQQQQQQQHPQQQQQQRNNIDQRGQRLIDGRDGGTSGQMTTSSSSSGSNGSSSGGGSGHSCASSYASSCSPPSFMPCGERELSLLEDAMNDTFMGDHEPPTRSGGARTRASRRIDDDDDMWLMEEDLGIERRDQQQRSNRPEPVIRKLTDEPIQIVHGYFHNTPPRTIPDILETSLERYFLEEMTLQVNLFGGHDFDDVDPDQLPVTDRQVTNTASTATSMRAARRRATSGTSLPGGGCLRRTGRVKHYSESSAGYHHRVHFGGGQVNLWESLDIKSESEVLFGAGGAPAPAGRSSPMSMGSSPSKSATGSTVITSVITAPDGSLLTSTSTTTHSTNTPSGGATSAGTSGTTTSASQSAGSASASTSVPPPATGSVRSDLHGTRHGGRSAQTSAEQKFSGGRWRQNEVCIQLSLNKVQLLYEVAETCRDTQPISWRCVLLVRDIEVRDRIQASDINKLLYEYCNEFMPRRSSHFLSVRNTATINALDGCEECTVDVSMKPVRLNIDQDTLLFLIEFFSAFKKSLAKYSAQRAADQQQPPTQPPPTHLHTAQAQAHQHSQSSTSVAGASGPLAKSSPSSAAVPATAAATAARSRPTSASGSSMTSAGSLHSRPASGGSGAGGPTIAIHQCDEPEGVYIKMFTFSPDVPIRIDYHAKHMDFNQGAIAGILMGLAHLDNSEIVLRRVCAKHGMRGMDRVTKFVLNAWTTDIKRKQLPSILRGVGPMDQVVQLFTGMRDLVWMPITHYRRDRRLVRGLQRGASSFSNSTAMATINLMNRFIGIVQCTAQIAHDIVTPPTLQSSAAARRYRHVPLRPPPPSLVGSLEAEERAFEYAGPAGGGAGAATLVAAAHTGASGGSATAASAGEPATSDHQQTHARQRQGHPRKRRLAAEVARERQLAAQAAAAASAPSGASSGLVAASGTLTTAHIGALNQPRNFCEGVAVGLNILKEGFNDTARNVAVGMQAEDMRSAVGELVRQIPGTLLNPIISVTEGAQNVLVGIRNQIAPDARREDQEKWKRRVRGK